MGFSFYERVTDLYSRSCATGGPGRNRWVRSGMAGKLTIFRGTGSKARRVGLESLFRRPRHFAMGSGQGTGNPPNRPIQKESAHGTQKEEGRQEEGHS